MIKLIPMTQSERYEFKELENTNDHIVNSFAKLSLKVDELTLAIIELQNTKTQESQL